MVGEIERLRLRLLEEAHAALLQHPRQPDEELARTKAAAETIDHAAGIKSLGRAVAPLELPCGQNLEERRPAVLGERHQRAEAALLHERVVGLDARHVGLVHGCHDRAVLHGGAQVVVVIERGKTLASLDRAAQERPDPLLRRQPCLIFRHAAAQLLLGQLRQHHVDGFGPPGQELPGIEPGRAFLAEGRLFDHDDIEPTPDRRFRCAQSGKAAARDQEIAAQVFIRA